MRVIKAAGVQVSPVLYSREGTVEKVVRKIRELGQQGVQFATFPETVVPYYPYFSFVQAPYQIAHGREHLKLLDQAVTVPSPATDATEQTEVNIRQHALESACFVVCATASLDADQQAQIVKDTFLLDKQGRIRWTHEGEGDYDEAERFIQRLLAEEGTKSEEKSAL